MYKAIITCAVTGAETTRDDNPNLPVTPEEIALSAYDAYNTGASIIHLHVRDKDGLPTQDTNIFKNVIAIIRGKCDIVIEVTTGGAVGMSLEERIQPLQLKPEIASLDCGTINFGNDYILNTLPTIKKIAKIMRDQNIRPTLECFDLSHIDTSKILIKENLLKAPFHYGFVLNVPGGVRYDTETLGFFLQRIPKNSFWTVMGIGGKASLQAIYGAISYGGFIRVGFEDNIFYSKGVLAKSNAELVERAVRVAKEYGCDIAKPEDVRKILQLKGM
ncbi:MAG: 3-keto-5-aminohexanoate cleavage protein [Candidatus Anammoxibacter sp.]